MLSSPQTHCRALYEEVVANRWTVCVPCTDSIRDEQLDEESVRQHIITQNGSELKTLAGVKVEMITTDRLILGGLPVTILFREDIYTSDSGILRALCVQLPRTRLGRSPSSESLSSVSGAPLTPSAAQQRIVREAVRSARHVISFHSNVKEEIASGALVSCTDRFTALLAGLDARTCACVVHNVHDQLVDFFTICVSKDDEQLNRARNNLVDVTPAEESSIRMTEAVAELDRLASRKSVEGKLSSLKETVRLLSETDKVPAAGLDADGLLTALSRLLERSTVTNWHSHLHFMKSLTSSSKYGEDSYYLSTLEAALGHLKTWVNKADQVLLRDTLPSQSLHKAARTGDLPTVRVLLSNSRFQCHPLCSCHSCGLPFIATPAAADERGMTALHYACLAGHADVVEALLACSDFKEDLAVGDSRGRTPLHYAAAMGFQTCLLLLCHHGGCNLDAVDRSGRTALHLAALNGHESCAKALLYYSEHDQCGIAVDARDAGGDTALHHACRWGFSKIVKLLMQWNANTAVINCKGERPVDVAQNLQLAFIITDWDRPSGLDGQQGSAGFWSILRGHLAGSTSKNRRKNGPQ